MPEGAELPAPPAPPAGAIPPADAAAPARVKKIKIVKLDRNGNTISEDIKDIPELADMPELKNMPDISSRRCDTDRKGNGKTVITADSMVTP